MSQKLTYGATTCNNYLYFTFYSEEFDPDVVASELTIEPTSVTKKKDPVPRSTSWKFEIVAGEDIDLVSPLATLLDLFEPKIEIIKNLKRDLKLETRLQFVIYIDIHPEASTPYFSLDRRTIDFLSKTGTAVSYDLYKADTVGLLNNYNNASE